MAMVIFVTSRFICTSLLKYVSPGGLLMTLTLGGSALTLGAIIDIETVGLGGSSFPAAWGSFILHLTFFAAIAAHRRHTAVDRREGGASPRGPHTAASRPSRLILQPSPNQDLVVDHRAVASPSFQHKAYGIPDRQLAGVL